MTTTTTLNVTGMSCGHCVAAVTTEVSKLDGVRSVDVDLAAHRVTVVSDGPISSDLFAAAIDEAGFELAT
jgi:copper chaperone